MHLNGFVDVISKAFLDIVIQPGQQPDERAALHSMLDHFDPDDPESYIITADRGYESYDLIFHCLLKNLSFVFRMKAPSSSRSIPLLNSRSITYIVLRVLKFKVDDNAYEYVITRLPKSLIIALTSLFILRE